MSDKIMHREISSLATPLYKAWFLLFIGVVVIGSMFGLIENLKTYQQLTAFQIFAYLVGMPITLFFAFLFLRLALSWKHVEIADDGLIITEANFFVKKTSTLVPFENIREAHQNFFLRGNPGTVTIEFIEPTFFGKKVRFVPKFRTITFLEHPIVGEINRLAGKNMSFLN